MVATMERKQTAFSRQYRTALAKRLKASPKSGGALADGMGTKALAAGLDALDLLKIHEQALSKFIATDGLSSATRTKAYGLAGNFLADAIRPIERDHLAAIQTLAPARARVRTLEKELATTNRRLKREKEKRAAAEKSLKLTARNHAAVLAHSRKLHTQLRRLSHRILMAQEVERKEISRELHDQIAQLLTGINNHLAALKVKDAVNTRDLAKKIGATQRLVEKSVNVVHRFARDLRPTLLDDLGLIPALQSHLKSFTAQSRVPVSFSASSEVERLDIDKKTVLYRVAQAALCNVAQHARASEVSLTLVKSRGTICMEIRDNGKSFNVERVLFSKRNERLGIIGMRERVEMVGGTFAIESAPGKGTTVSVCIPLRDSPKS
jgi:signal transduction histidine kinase